MDFWSLKQYNRSHRTKYKEKFIKNKRPLPLLLALLLAWLQACQKTETGGETDVDSGKKVTVESDGGEISDENPNLLTHVYAETPITLTGDITPSFNGKGCVTDGKFRIIG